MIASIILASLGIVIYVLYHKFTRRNLPPGPIPLPIIGNLIELARTDGLPHEVLHSLAKKYGNVYSLMIGIVPTVAVNGYEPVRAVFKNEDFSNRIQHDWILDRTYGKPQGLIFAATDSQKETRQLTIKILKEFGFGKKATMEELILEEFREFIQEFKEKVVENDVVLIDSNFSGPMANIVWSLLSGERFNIDSPELAELLAGMDGFSHTQVGGTKLLGAFPFLGRIAPELSGFAEILRCNAKLREYFERVVKKYREKGTYRTNPMNPIEAFLAEIDNNQDSSSQVYTDENLVCIMNDLFTAGTETCGHLSGFTVRLMVQYPEIQAKVRAEIDEVMAGKNENEMVTCEAQPLLRYTQATILEAFRSSTPAKISPRFLLKTCNLGPFEIPEGTTVVVNTFSADQDESVWGDPGNFRPERFLNDSGEIINSEKLLSFGFGKRSCLGEETGRTSVFIGFSNLIRNFVFEPDPTTGVPTSENIMGMTCSPKPFKIRVKIRPTVF